MIAAIPANQAASEDPRVLFNRVEWPLLLASIFLIFVSACSVHLVTSSRSSSDLMNRALQFENKLWGVIASTRIAESEQRGYLLTGDSTYLGMFRESVDGSLVKVGDLKSAAVGDPDQHRALTEIESMIVRKFAELRETIHLHDAGDHAAALALVQTGEGRELMAKIRAPIIGLMEQQRRLVSQQTSKAQSGRNLLLAINLAGLALIIVSTMVSVVVLRRTATRRLARSNNRGDKLQATVSESEQAEARMAQMEARSRGLLEAAPKAMVVVDRHGEIVLVNLQAEKHFGYHRDELLGQKVTRIIPKGFAQRLLTDGVEVLAQEITTGIELTGRLRNGSECPIELKLSPLDGGEGILAVRDVSLRRDTEKKLALMEARYHCLLQAAPDAMVVVNNAGEIVLLNLQAEKEFGYHRDELLGQNINKILPERAAERLIAMGARSPRTALVSTKTELTGRRKAGDEFPIEVMLSPLESTERILVIRDISERRKIERLKDEFVSTVSHELRTPLTSISGSLGLLTGQWASKLPESAARLLTIAHTNSQRLVRLINDILDIEKLESGRVVFNLRKVAVRPLVENAIEDNRGFAESYGVVIRLDPSSTDLDVNADPDRLAQVVTNLLSNAIKFSATDGEVTVGVEQSGDYVRITVRDHGCGVSEDFKQHIFEKFAQADATNTKQKGGTGLGLSIVKQIVERLAGAAGFRDAPGGGAIFYVDLPAWDGTAGGEIDHVSGPEDVRILLCDDDRMLAMAVRERLRESGFAVDFAHTVAAAIVRTNATCYAAILMDLRLPDGDGIGLIVRLRTQANCRKTPIIVVAGDVERGRSDVRSSRLNVLHWMDKPVDFNSLVEILRAALVLPGRRRPRILHVDDDHSVLAMVAHELLSVAEIVSTDGIASARRALVTDRIDLAVLDVALGDDSGLDLLPDLRSHLGQAIPVIVFSTHIAGIQCDEQIRVALSKKSASLATLEAVVCDQLAILPAQRSEEHA